MELLRQIADSLCAGETERVAQLTRQALDAGLGAREILDKGLIAGMDRIGRLFQEEEVFLPDVLLAAKAMYAGLEVLKPLLEQQRTDAAVGRVVIGTVQGDLHDIGKNLVSIMLRGAGFEVIDLGNDVAPEKFVQVACEQNCQIIGMSALLTTTMPVMGKVCELLREKNLAGRIKTIIGGAPVSEAFAREIGADAYCYDAAAAVATVRRLLSQ